MRATCELGARDVISFLCTWNGIPSHVPLCFSNTSHATFWPGYMPFDVHKKEITRAVGFVRRLEARKLNLTLRGIKE
jgi:hypothetical protein